MLADYHIHTPLCRHAVGEPLEYVAIAKARGLDEIGFSDHSPMDDPEPFDDWRMSRADLPRYVDMILAAREAAAPFPVRLGLECDYIAGREDWIEELAAAAPWDYLIGSVHYLGTGEDVDNPKWIGRYFQDAAQCGGNLGPLLAGVRALRRQRPLRLRGAPRPRQEIRPPAAGRPAPVLRADGGWPRQQQASPWKSARRGCASRWVNSIPPPDCSTMAREAGIPVVINSDAHAPEETGQDFRAGRRGSARGGLHGNGAVYGPPTADGCSVSASRPKGKPRPCTRVGRKTCPPQKKLNVSQSAASE